jgi:hypothetical protein
VEGGDTTSGNASQADGDCEDIAGCSEVKVTLMGGVCPAERTFTGEWERHHHMASHWGVVAGPSVASSRTYGGQGSCNGLPSLRRYCLHRRCAVALGQVVVHTARPAHQDAAAAAGVGQAAVRTCAHTDTP